jgi:hypothetical protein
MFAVSGPGILLLSIFAVPACGLLFVLWKPKKQQSATKDLPSDVIAPVNGGSLRQAKYEAQEEPSSTPAPEYQVEEEISNEHDTTLGLEVLDATSLQLDESEDDGLTAKASAVVALGLSEELSSFEQSPTTTMHDSGLRSEADIDAKATDDDTVSLVSSETALEELHDELDTSTETEGDKVAPGLDATQHPIPPMPPTAPTASVPEKAPRAKKVRNKMATFPFDVSVWDDPLSPRAMRRKQRKAERLEAAVGSKRLRSKEQKDISGGNTAPVALHYDAAVEKSASDVFLDVWAQASGAEAPDEVGKLVTERGASRGRRKAERESRSLEKLADKRKKKEARDATKPRKVGSVSDGVSGFPEDVESGFGDSAVLAGAEIVDGEGVSFIGEGVESPDLEVGTWDVDFEEEDGADGLSPKSKRGVKRAERESRALEKLTAKRRKSDGKAASGDAGGQRTSDLTEDLTGVGEHAVLAADIAETTGVSAWELAAQAETVDPSSNSEALTWESAAGAAGASEQGMGVEAVSAWDQAAETASLQGSVVEFTPQAITSSSDLLEMGAAVVIGDGPGQGGDAWFVPEGFDEYEEEPRRRASRRRKRRGDDDEVEEAVGGGWTDGGVLVEADENIDFRAYDLPEPVPARASVMFGEEE